MFRVGQRVRFNKHESEDMWRVFGRRGRVFEVIEVIDNVATHNRMCDPMYRLRNTVKGAVYHQTYFSGSLLISAE